MRILPQSLACPCNAWLRRQDYLLRWTRFWKNLRSFHLLLPSFFHCLRSLRSNYLCLKDHRGHDFVSVYDTSRHEHRWRVEHVTGCPIDYNMLLIDTLCFRDSNGVQCVRGAEHREDRTIRQRHQPLMTTSCQFLSKTFVFWAARKLVTPFRPRNIWSLSTI